MTPLSLLGLGAALPDRVVTNDEVETMTGLAASRIRELFEIDERRWSRGADTPDPVPGQRCSDLAIAASRSALAEGGLEAGDLGALIVVTTTPDSLNPPIDSLVARGLGLLGVPAFSLQTPCTGVFRALRLASALVPSLEGRPVLVVAAETPSPFFRFGPDVANDQTMNAALYADGAGAIVVGGVGSGASGGRPVIDDMDLVVNGDAAAPAITFPGMLSASPPSAERFARGDDLGHHDFRRVLRRGSRLAASAALDLLRRTNTEIADVRYFVTHQATGNIRRIAASYGLPPEKIPVNIQRVGNTVSASILILLNQLAREGAIARGDRLILHTAESSTWSSAAASIRW